MAEEIITRIREEFKFKMLDETWIRRSYSELFENPNNSLQKAIDKIIEERQQPIVNSIESLYLHINDNKKKQDLSNTIAISKATLGKNEQEVYLAPIDNFQDERFNYNRIISDLIATQFNEYGNFNSIYGVVNQAVRKYEEEDEIHTIMNITGGAEEKMRDILHKKKGREFTDRLYFEQEVIKKYQEEALSRDEYSKINNDPLTKCYYTDNNIKLYFEKTFKDVSIFHMIKLLYNHDAYSKWFPFISKSKTHSYFSKSKKIYYERSEIPIIQDRELYLYGFVHNNLKRDRKIYFYSKSCDNLTTGETEDIFKGYVKPKNEEDILRIYAHNICFELEIRGKNEANLIGHVDLAHKLKFVNIQLVEVISKQIVKKIIEKLKEVLTDNDKIESYVKFPTKEQQEFDDFYRDVVNQIENTDNNNMDYDKAKDSSLNNTIASKKKRLSKKSTKLIGLIDKKKTNGDLLQEEDSSQDKQKRMQELNEEMQLKTSQAHDVSSGRINDSKLNVEVNHLMKHDQSSYQN